MEKNRHGSMEVPREYKGRSMGLRVRDGEGGREEDVRQWIRVSQEHEPCSMAATDG